MGDYIILMHEVSRGLKNVKTAKIWCERWYVFSRKMPILHNFFLEKEIKKYSI